MNALDVAKAEALEEAASELSYGQNEVAVAYLLDKAKAYRELR